MRIGLVGPSSGDERAFRDAALFLLTEVEVDQVIYLGHGEFVDAAIERWGRELAGEDSDATFLEEAIRLAPHGSAAELDELLARDTAARRLSAIRKLPPSPARAIEMIDDRLVLLVYDKAVLDEDDIANANVIVYGKSNECDLRKFGRRAFFTPGPLQGSKIGVLESAGEGVAVSLYRVSGEPVFREVVAQSAARVTVGQ